MTLTKQELTEISEDRQAASGAAAGETQLGDDIPDDKVRYVWRITIGNPAAAIDTLTIYQGDAVSKTRTTKKTIELEASKTLELGGSIEDPIMILRPDTSGDPTEGNGIYLMHATAAMNVMMEYYDL